MDRTIEKKIVEEKVMDRERHRDREILMLLL